jgi:hypothetical protein
MDHNGGRHLGRSRAPTTIDDTGQQGTVRIIRQANPDQEVHEVPPDPEIEAAIEAWEEWEAAIRRTNTPGLRAWRRRNGPPRACDPGE